MKIEQSIRVPLKLIWVGEHAVCYDKKAVGQVLPRLVLELDFNGDYRGENNESICEFIDQFFVDCESSLTGFDRSQIPDFKVNGEEYFGIGLGTSAALAVALAHLVAKVFPRISSFQLLQLIEETESKSHTKPSGIDQYLVCQQDGVHAFQNGEGHVCAKGFPFPFAVFNTGGDSTTSAMVEMVRDRWNTDRSKVFNLMRKAGRLSYDLISSFSDPDYKKVLTYLVKSQEFLVNLGVVEPRVAEFCQRLKAFRIAAKVSGGGGTNGGSGIIIACYARPEDYNQARQLADLYGFDLIYKAHAGANGYG